jgi:ribosomal protein L29
VYIIIRKGKEITNMTREEITKRIEDLEERKFYLRMADHWTRKDYEYFDKWNNEIRELKKELENV